MSEKQTKQSPKPASASTEKNPVGNLQQVADEANERGYIGHTPDETPNSDYTVAGVTKKAKS